MVNMSRTGPWLVSTPRPTISANCPNYDNAAYAELKKETRASQPTTVVQGRSTLDPTRERSKRLRTCHACGNLAAEHEAKTCPWAHTELDLRPRCACLDLDCDAVITNYNPRSKNPAPRVARFCPTRC